MASSTQKSLIAPCGMNCGLCYAYLREKDRCLGCRELDDGKKISRASCKIKNCSMFKSTKAKFCVACREFPCDRLKHLDKRYRAKYHMSMIENLLNIKRFGIKGFMINEKKKWTCATCGGTFCVHKGYCLTCANK